MDVLQYQTNDNGEITIEDGQVKTTDGIETAIYLSLFGGNADDDGSQDNPNQWWGNHSETEPARKYRSETQHLLGGIPATSANLKRIEDAVKRDLSWLDTAPIVNASILALNRVKIEIQIDADQFTFSEAWQ